MIKNIVQTLQSGFSKRWHSNPDMSNRADDLSQHQWSVAMICLYLKPYCSKDLLVEALTHDVGEMVAGDLGYDFKINNPVVAEAHKEAEEAARNELVSAQRLTEDETKVLKLADWISSFWWVATHHPALLSRQDWQEQIDYFIKESKSVNKAYELIVAIGDIADRGYTDKIDLNWEFGKGLKEYDAA